MKRILYATMLLLGIGVLTCSCEKSDKVNLNRLEGKWWIPVKGEIVLNGTAVKDSPGSSFVMDFKAYFENGNCTCVDMGDGSTYVLAYSLIDDVLHIGQGIWGSVELNVIKLTRDEGIVEERSCGPLEDYEYESSNGETIVITKEELIASGKILDTCCGTDIYSEGGYSFPPFWYYNGKGEAMQCEYHECTLKPFEEWQDMLHPAFSYDYWYDADRYYFKAE